MQKDVIESYVAAVIEHGEKAHNGDYRGANKAYDRGIEALAEFRKLPDRGERILLWLLHHPNDWVKLNAATDLLLLNEAAARPVLEHLAAGPAFHVDLSAENTLREWDAGRLRSLLPKAPSREQDDPDDQDE